jgi:hypothetical protein
LRRQRQQHGHGRSNSDEELKKALELSRQEMRAQSRFTDNVFFILFYFFWFVWRRAIHHSAVGIGAPVKADEPTLPRKPVTGGGDLQARSGQRGKQSGAGVAG